VGKRNPKPPVKEEHMKTITAVLLTLALTVSAHAQWGPAAPKVKIIAAENLPENLRNIGAARGIYNTLLLIPNWKELDWKIVVEDHDTFQNDYNKTVAQKGMGSQHFPQRCWTYTELRETHCDVYFAAEFSAMAKAGTLAHEYGHILCGKAEQDADRCGAELMRGVASNEIK
jgi:hypothetical protein